MNSWSVIYRSGSGQASVLGIRLCAQEMTNADIIDILLEKGLHAGRSS